MGYFSINRPLFIVPSKKCCENLKKIDKFMNLLENPEFASGGDGSTTKPYVVKYN